jgi:hypothetical protein
VPLLIELKGESTNSALVPKVLECLEGYRGEYCIESFNPMLLRAVKKQAPHIVRGLLSTDLIKEKKFEGRILELGASFSTHAEALNICFGTKYKHYQKAYKEIGGGYAVWFPSIARKVLGKYVSTDNYSGWVNILSEDQKTLLQVDNPIYGVREKKHGPDKRIVFAKFEGDKRYRFIGVYRSEKRVKNGYEHTRLGTKFDTVTYQILDD